MPQDHTHLNFFCWFPKRDSILKTLIATQCPSSEKKLVKTLKITTFLVPTYAKRAHYEQHPGLQITTSDW